MTRSTNFISGLAAIATAFALPSLDAGAQSVGTQALSASDWRIPADAQSVLTNVLLAIDRGWVLDEAFLADDGLLKGFFNATEVHRTEQPADHRTPRNGWHLISIYKINPGRSWNDNKLDPMGPYCIQIYFHTVKGDVVHAELTLPGFDAPYVPPTYDDTFRLLGSGWVEDKNSEGMALTDGAYDDSLIFNNNSPKLKKRAALTFKSDAARHFYSGIVYIDRVAPIPQ